MKRFYQFATVFLTLFSLFMPISRAEEEIKIGVITTLTGPKAPIGERQKRGYKMALGEINAKGGINGKRVKLIYKDDAGKSHSAIAAFEDLLTEQVVAIIGSYSSFCTFQLAGLGERYNVPLLSPCAAIDKLTKQGFRWLFRLNATSSQYVEALLEFVVEQHPRVRRMIIVREDTPFGLQETQKVKEVAKRFRVQVSRELIYSPGESDFYPLLSILQKEKPRLILLISTATDAIQFLKQSREVKLSPWAFLGIGAGFLMPRFVSRGVDVRYVITATQWIPNINWPGAKEFAEKYEERYKEPAEYHSAETYAALHVMADAIKRAGCYTSELDCRKAIRDALKKTDMMTAFGPVKFVDFKGYTNQNRHPIAIVQIQDGALVTIWPPEYSTGNAAYPFPGWETKPLPEEPTE